MPRIPSLPIKEWPAAMREAIAALRPAVMRHPQLTTDGDRPKGINALGTFANYPELTHGFHSFTGHLLYGTSLSLRQRELLVLRVATLRACEYEWLQHIVIGSDVGITDEEIDRVRGGAQADGWEPLEAALLRAADELIADAKVSDATWAALSESLTTEQLMDVVFTVGGYDLLAMALLSFEVEIDDDLAKRKRPSPFS